jgi:serine/threonine protein kinase
VRAYDAGHDGNVYFLVTEYVPGTDLRRLVRSQGRLTMAQTAAVISQAALGLGYAHQQGLVHRDVKPGNLLVTPDALVKVSDLGLAGFLHEGDDDPRAGKIVGTADYLAPEMITNPKTVTPVSDIYALGCTLYYAVTGKVPFPGGTTRDKARRHCEETPWHPRQFNADISDDFVDLIADMMDKDPQRRVQTASEVNERLQPWADQRTALPYPIGTRSSWTAPPVPTSIRDETVEDFAEMGPSATPSDDQTPVPATRTVAAPATGNAASAITSTPFSATAQPTGSLPQTQRAVLLALSIAVPLAMTAGGLLTWLFLEFLN